MALERTVSGELAPMQNFLLYEEERGMHNNPMW